MSIISSILLLLLFVLLIVFGVVVFNLITKPNGKKNEAHRVSFDARPKWQGWIWPVIIALLLAFWSTVFALFFLAILWVMRLNPKTDSKEISFPSDKDRKRASGTYIWLLFSPFLNVIVLLIGVFNSYSSRTPTNEWVLVALVPLVFHLPVLVRLDSKSPFVFRHTQQAIFLLALRASMTALALNIGSSPEDGILLFIFGNGFLWLAGSIWGLNQVTHDTGWWIKHKGEVVLGKDTPSMPVETELSLQRSPKKSIEYGKWYWNNNNKESAQKHALTAFRNGNADIRSQAVQLLNELGEVEKF